LIDASDDGFSKVGEQLNPDSSQEMSRFLPPFFVTEIESEGRQCRVVILFSSPVFMGCPPSNQYISFTAKHLSRRLIADDAGSAFGKRGASARACDTSKKNQPT